MKLYKTLVVCSIVFSVAVASFSATTATAQNTTAVKNAGPKLIPIDWRLGNYINSTVAIESPVYAIRHVTAKSLIVLDQDFLVVCLPSGIISLAKAGIELDSLPGKTVRITGKLYKDTKYGIQMDLTKASQLVITKELASATTRRYYSRSTTPEAVIPFEGVISVSEATAHIGQTGTVEGKVVRARKSDLFNIYYLEFSSKPKEFMAVFDYHRGPDAYSWDTAFILGLKDKTVQVTGKITVPEQSGPQILLRRAEDLKVIGK